MKGFTERIVELMKSENLFESQGGPIILSQVKKLMEQYKYSELVIIQLCFFLLKDLCELTERCHLLLEFRLRMSMEDKGRYWEQKVTTT